MDFPQQYVILVAAGSGTRFGGPLPKQFMDLDGVPVAVRGARTFGRALPHCRFIVVLPQDDTERWKSLIMSYLPSETIYVTGGTSRWESVKNGLATIPPDTQPHTPVLVHDAARPLVSTEVIDRVVRAVVNTDGVIPVVPVTDSLRKADRYAPCGTEAVNRTDYMAVQTPQAATLWRFRQAYELPYDPSFTDDASVLVAAGFVNIVTVDGSPYNMKITNPLDLSIARAIMEYMQTPD